jgi:hypothetical protein
MQNREPFTLASANFWNTQVNVFVHPLAQLTTILVLISTFHVHNTYSASIDILKRPFASFSGLLPANKDCRKSGE